jgi:YfiH family protein
LLSKVPGILHGFGDRATPVPPITQGGGASELSASDWDKLWEEGRARCKQVHGTECREVTSFGQDCGDCDARYSKLEGVPIHALSADCVPVLLAHRDGRAVAAVHAGWRGTQARILEEVARVIERDGSSLSDWVAAIGPAIGPCCYEVSEALADEFHAEFKAYPEADVVPAHRRLDLPRINELQLRALGIGEVELIRACTRCAKGHDGKALYHSYRREGAGTREWSVIMRTRKSAG